MPAEILQSLDETLAQINQMTEMVENLLTLARADEGRAPLAVEESDLRDLLGDVAETAGMLGESVGHHRDERRCRTSRCGWRWTGTGSGRCCSTWSPTRSSTRRRAARSTSAWPSEDGAVSFTVRDTGIGIAAGDLPHIFDRFWRADPARSRTGDRPGTGLGLAITKWIAEAHGGSITVQSRPGRGTMFTVRLPREVEHGQRGRERTEEVSVT